MATFTLASGFTCFETFCHEAGILEPADEIIALPTGLISDDDASADEMEDDNDDDNSIEPTANDSMSVDSNVKDTATTVEFDLNGPATPASEGERTATPTSTVNIISDEEDRQPSDLAELLMLHHQYGHISMRKLQEMAKQGTIPRRLAKCRIPTCSACLFSKATKKPWRGKESKEGDGKKKPTRPGQVVSVDQLVSPTPGLVAQMTGFMTTKRYNYATIYVDQMTRFGYVYLQKTASAEETIESKKALEAVARRHGVRIEHYHADNGIFKANAWVEACRKDGQGISYAGVNAHHQNGIAERRIRELQELARAMLIHANARWKGSITANLWPYAVRMASEAVNNTPSFQDPTKRTPIEMFSGTKATSNPKHWKPFGRPTYVLDNDLQGRKPFHKWRQRPKPGIYLGVSPVHDRNVALVLSRDTGLASPQFHVAFDPRFDTVKDITTESKWQLKAGFVIQRELYEKKARKLTTEKPIGDNTSSRNRRKRKRSEATTEQQPETRKSHELSTQPAAATIGDGGHPMPPNQSGTQREAEREHTITRSGRKARAAPRLIEAMTSEIARATAGDVEGEIYCYATMFPDDDAINQVDPLLAYKAVSDSDTLYYHQAMKEHDCEEFRDSMDKEVKDQYENGNFTVVHRSQVPEGQTILPAVWQMRRKRDAKTGAI